MTFDFFEGPAGTGKTHNLVGRAAGLVNDGALGEGHRLIALTFMNGARRRLEARLAADSTFVRRFDCRTFDVFARALTARRKSLLTAVHHEQAARLSEFDAPCFLAASLLEARPVQLWVARTFPIVLVDEAQDLDEHRLGILRGLSHASSIVAAADAFQCLADGRDTADLIGWLEGAGQVHRLTQPHRTNQQGLLTAALVVRQGGDLRAALNASTSSGRTTWRAPGFRLLEVPAQNAGLIAWSIANEMSQRRGQFAILTPDARSTIVRTALDTLMTRIWTRAAGQPFGPYPHTWDRQEADECDAVLANIDLPESATWTDLQAVLAPATMHSAVVQACRRMDRLRRLTGQAEFAAADVRELVRECLRNQYRLGYRQQQLGHLAMTIPRAKNREFENVIVLWPHSATGSHEHLRRLLYNAITRARSHCSVIVFGQGRVGSPPFAPLPIRNVN